MRNFSSRLSHRGENAPGRARAQRPSVLAEQNVCLEKGPDEIRSAEGEPSAWRAEEWRPGMLATFNTIMDNCGIRLASGPALTNHILLLKEDHRLARAAIALCPTSEPGRNRRKAEWHASQIGHNGISSAMYLQNRYGSFGVASARRRIIRAGNRGKCSHSACHRAG